MRWLRCVLLTLTVLVLGACADPDEGRAVLDRGLSSEPESLDPQKARSVQAADVLRDLREGLLGYSATGELQPAGAISWEIGDDGHTITFKLREKARWSNGDPVLAEHYVAGLQRLADPATASFYANTISDIESVTAIDDFTLRIELERPVPYLLALLTHPSTFPAHGEHTNGAYRLVDAKPRRTVTARAQRDLLEQRRNGH